MPRGPKDDLKPAIAEERGRLKPAQAAAKKLYEKRMQQCENLLNRATEEEVLEVIRGAGIDPGSPQGAKILRIWRENRRP